MNYQLKLLEVGEGESRLEIDTVPQVIATASSVFRSMLPPDILLESQKVITLTLPEDDPSAMKVLCDALHFQSDKAPMKGMTPSLLASIATAVDKYDCARAIQLLPLKVWLSESLLSLQTPWNPGNPDFLRFPELTMWIYISWHFDYEDQFQACTSSLIRRARNSDHQDQKIPGYEQLPGIVRGKFFLSSAGIPSIDSIKEARDECINSFQQICFTTVRQIQQQIKPCSKSKPTDSDWSDEDWDRANWNCSALLLGRAILAAQEICNGQD